MRLRLPVAEGWRKSLETNEVELAAAEGVLWHLWHGGAANSHQPPSSAASFTGLRCERSDRGHAATRAPAAMLSMAHVMTVAFALVPSNRWSRSAFFLALLALLCAPSASATAELNGPVKPHGHQWLSRLTRMGWPAAAAAARAARDRREADDDFYGYDDDAVAYCVAQDTVETCQPLDCIFVAQCTVPLEQDDCIHFFLGKSEPFMSHIPT